MRDLIAGERAPAAGATTFVLAGGAPPPLALVALGPDRRAAADFAPIDSITRELRSGVGFEEATRLRIDPAALPAGIDRLLLIAFDPANRPIDARLTIASDTLRFAVDPGGQAAAAVILIELYRHQGRWRIAANGQGFAVGLSAIAAAYGLDRAWCDRLNPRLQDDTPDRGDRSGQSSGSGIAIEAHHILTNAHVVEDVRTISVHVGGRTLAAEMVFADPRNDLALLRVDTPLMQIAQFRSQVGLHLGEDVVALGFPLQGLLGTGPQASAGNIAALCGIGNDSSVFQFTAPIASGNSGGPILDMAGHLIGLVSSSLNLDRIRRSGASAENINFGIKGAMILSFLDSHGLEPQMAHDVTPIGRTAVVARTRSAIARIACQC
ncbi:trypsin-like peptidase domain-containing protein [Sphingomonas sp. Leaf4]|uniref:trypsin-like peptidase domain-containing protein n=1 Tax=Sphingomonas sp. Leaf4 TaxID=2876553 RepID=UPI001E602ECF|nr:trypsin-like peptidase domain-containing protein [Sphingomonas sp. Leaf4]